MNMTTAFLPNNHYSLNAECDVRAICKPFFDEHHLMHFTYLRYYNDGKFFILISNGDLLQHHLSNGYILTPHLPKNLLDKQIHYIPAPDLDDGFNEAILDYKNLFNMSYPIYMFERYQNYFDLYVFASTLNSNKSINYYINNMQTLYNFKLYFKEKAAKLIHDSDKNLIRLPNNMRPNFGGIDSASSKNEYVMPFKSINLTGNYAGVSITKRELDVFKHLIKGSTVRELSAVLQISPRTAEVHVNKVRHKLAVKKKSEAIRILQDNYLL